MRSFLVIITLCLFASFSKFNEKRPEKTLYEKILIINSFDAESMNTRKNKKLLFGELADSLKQMLYAELDTKIPAERVVIPELIDFQNNDSVYFEVIKKYSATKAIVIKNVNAYFNQTGVEVTRGSDGKKERSASYDIVADVDYTLYDDAKKIKDFHTQVWEYFTDRTVISGLLAGGPDIVGKHKHAFKIVRKNAQQFVRELKAELDKN